MQSLFAFVASFALLSPFSQGDERAAAKDEVAKLDPKVALEMAQSDRTLINFSETPVYRQVRINGRVIIRVSPQSAQARRAFLSTIPRNTSTTKVVEKKMEKCIPVSQIAAVQTGSANRLMLYLRDKRVVRLNLEKSCRARDYYSGFYVERRKDGKLCVRRDKLLSRSGVNCQVKRMRQLVSVAR
jgi:hypothetical protein